jgi:hypothetical protein
MRQQRGAARPHGDEDPGGDDMRASAPFQTHTARSCRLPPGDHVPGSSDPAASGSRIALARLSKKVVRSCWL